MIQNTQFLQLSMLKINNVYWSNEIANYIILFNLVKPKINEVFILSFEKLKKHFVDLLNLMSRKTKSKKLQHLNYQVDTWKFQNYFYKFNGFESTLIFKVQTHILFVKASFTSKKNVFSQMLTVFIKIWYPKGLNDMQNYAHHLVNIKTFYKLSNKLTHSVYICS